MSPTTTTETGQRWMVNEPAVVSETVDDETIVIPLETGCHYSLSGTAAECWDILRQRGQDDFPVTALESRDTGTTGESWMAPTLCRASANRCQRPDG